MNFSKIIKKLSTVLDAELENSGGICGIEIDGIPVIMQDCNDLILLRADLGALPEKNRERLLSASLEANFLYQGTGGCTLAIDGDTDHLCIQRYDFNERLNSPDDIAIMIQKFIYACKIWKSMLDDTNKQNTEDNQPDVKDSILDVGMLS
ncbi:type III secretion system chaperone [uncultured Succinivibrio sp.]|uniref:type III secretion system chaperone n=1 Tax=uncultured Succinivibrio sp. TaxID=540749 RepID=UPI0025E8103D|nr:type III secretion system chaperone [uncultured Succinivibrio sp.]